MREKKYYLLIDDLRAKYNVPEIISSEGIGEYLRGFLNEVGMRGLIFSTALKYTYAKNSNLLGLDF